MKLEGTWSPRQGPRKCQLLATPWFALSLSMIALGGSGLSGGFRLITLSVGRTINGTILDTVVVSRDVEGASYEELGWRVKLKFTVPFYSACRAQLLCLLDYYTMGL
jgi:hypothetical protein